MSKFQREYEIEIDTNDSGVVSIKNPLTIEFNLTRNIFASANTGDFKIYNLGAITRNKIYKNQFDFDVFRSVVLKAGYSKQKPVIFDGNIKYALSYKDQGAVNYITELSCYDGGFDIVNSRTSETLGAGATFNSVVDSLIPDLKNTKRGVISNIEGTHDRGRSLEGNTMNLLSEETGDAAYIDNGLINILKDNECIQGDILVIKSSTGLLGSPKRMGALITVNLLFEPKVKIGQIVSLESQTEKNYNGVYKVVGFSHSGTISGAVGGSCQTSVSLWFGTGRLEVISGR